MAVSADLIEEVSEYFYEGLEESIRAVTLTDGRVMFLANDVVTRAVGVVNSFSLTKAVDFRCKLDVIISFDEEINPQRYIFIDIYGVYCVVNRARGCKVDRLDFIKWAEEIAGA